MTLYAQFMVERRRVRAVERERRDVLALVQRFQKRPDYGVGVGSPLAVGAGQTGRSISVRVSTR